MGVNWYVLLVGFLMILWRLLFIVNSRSVVKGSMFDLGENCVGVLVCVLCQGFGLLFWVH